MKRIGINFLILGVIFVLFLSACGGTDTPPPPPPATDVPPAGQPPEPPPEPPPPLEPVNLAGPPMEVGSRFLYVDGSVLIAVPGGDFIMGHDRDDNPEHIVFLDDFWIYRSAVTNAQYARCVESGQCALPDLSLNTDYGNPLKSNNPATGVNWEQGESYCSFVHAWLPTEAQWEKAIRGPEGEPYPWGREAPTCDLLNAANCVNKTTDVTAYAHAESFYGAFDGAGNVFEWVADWYDPTYYSVAPPDNPLGPEFGARRSVRSSGFGAAFFETEVARRFSAKPEDSRNDLGFRCVPEDPLYFAPYCEQALVYGFNFQGGIPLPSTTSETCPTIQFVEGKFCGDNNTPLTNVTISAVSPATPLSSVNPGSCTDQGGNLYQCTSGTTLTACAECQVNIVDDPGCPPPLVLQGGKCVIEVGFPGECLRGYEFDPVKECCTAVDIPFGVNNTCPVGTYFALPPGACLPIPAAGTVCDDFSPGFKDCRPGYSSLLESSPLVSALEEEQPRQTPIAPVSGVLTLSTLGLAGWLFYGGRKRS